MLTAAESACHGSPEKIGLRVERLPFERIPHQSRLFLSYLRDPESLRRFYPSAVRHHYEVAARSAEVLAAYRVDRAALCDALDAMHRRLAAPPETFAQIERLRRADTVAVVSGQQAGLFTGPLYTIYKALSAIKLAHCLSGRGLVAVPVFWIATEDHDWAEVRRAEVVACDGRLASVEIDDRLHAEGAPVGHVRLDQSIDGTIQRLLELLPSTEFTPALERLLRDAYAPGFAYGESFARMMLALLGKHGLIVLDPLDANLKRLAAPLYAEAARRAPEIASALVARSRELEEAGFHAQVVASPDAFPLFVHLDGARRAIARAAEGRYRIKGTEQEHSLEELANWIEREPLLFSPNVTLRSVVQDYLLPTIAYYGGAAEIAYFAQTSEVYRVLQRPATPIFHRASMTIVERRMARTLARYNLHLADLFAGSEAVIARVVEGYLGRETARRFDQAEKQINEALDGLQAELLRFDPTLAAALDGGRKKIYHQLKGLRLRFHRAQMARDRAVHRQIERAFNSLYPEKTLQERKINITSLLARHGQYVVDWLYETTDPDATDHLIVYL